MKELPPSPLVTVHHKDPQSTKSTTFVILHVEFEHCCHQDVVWVVQSSITHSKRNVDEAIETITLCVGDSFDTDKCQLHTTFSVCQSGSYYIRDIAIPIPNSPSRKEFCGILTSFVILHVDFAHCSTRGVALGVLCSSTQREYNTVETINLCTGDNLDPGKRQFHSSFSSRQHHADPQRKQPSFQCHSVTHPTTMPTKGGRSRNGQSPALR